MDLLLARSRWHPHKQEAGGRGNGPSPVADGTKGFLLGKIKAVTHTQKSGALRYLPSALPCSPRGPGPAKENGVLAAGLAGSSLGFGHLPAAALDQPGEKKTWKDVHFHPLNQMCCKNQKLRQPRGEPCLEHVAFPEPVSEGCRSRGAG